jgi:hypothetical protein
MLNTSKISKMLKKIGKADCLMMNLENVENNNKVKDIEKLGKVRKNYC